ncbi:DUF1294 domain-containing protein [Acinetobacter sp. P8-3-8]|uniref:DUF1294 domain-containing protein n=1 Tax=Acinetobacter sp. P8-3-8 TaxID=1029823 RepID=UPI000248714D|nr:DUF1294 domain-containing protein [Acinetobacter sp. P8-3-8]
MRDQGRLVEWFDDKGYGFIQPNDEAKDRVFLHIKDFAQKGPRPLVGCALEYVVQLDAQGRFKAKQVTYLKANQAKKLSKMSNSTETQTPAKLQAMQILCVVYIIALVILTATGLLNSLALLFMSIINVMTYWFYSQDKEAAQLNQRRVPENTLHILAFLGGWPAAWLAQQRLRHKTQKQPFRKVYFCTIFFNILLILWLISPLNVFKT